MAQTTMILDYMQEHGSITAKDAAKEPISCMRLAARIADLKRLGFVIIAENEVNKTTGKHYARYRLAEAKDVL